MLLQEAAGAFAYLAEQVVPRLAAPQPIDLSPDCCGMLSTLCLAQVSSTQTQQFTLELPYSVGNSTISVWPLSHSCPQLLDLERRLLRHALDAVPDPGEHQNQ